jgi:hypothetical protein
MNAPDHPERHAARPPARPPTALAEAGVLVSPGRASVGSPLPVHPHPSSSGPRPVSAVGMILFPEIP